MMKFKRTLPLLGLMALALAAPVQAADAPRAQHVFIISYDMAVPAVVQKADMPTFHEMAKQGAHTWEAYTIVPSITLPSHTSMVTGVGIQKHQVLWNNWMPEKGLVQVPTIFALAKQKGLVTALYAGKEKFKHLNIPNSLDVFSIPGAAKPGVEATASEIAKAFAADVGRLKPNLALIHFPDPDTTGHASGVDSPEQLQALADCDAALKVIKDAIAAAGLMDSSVFILTSDHGAHNTTDRNGKTVGAHSLPDKSDVEIPWVVWGAKVKKGYTITAPVVTYDTAATALWLLGLPIPEDFWGRPVTSAFE